MGALSSIASVALPVIGGAVAGPLGAAAGNLVAGAIDGGGEAGARGQPASAGTQEFVRSLNAIASKLDAIAERLPAGAKETAIADVLEQVPDGPIRDVLERALKEGKCAQEACA
jgi:hypothetical protein